MRQQVAVDGDWPARRVGLEIPISNRPAELLVSRSACAAPAASYSARDDEGDARSIEPDRLAPQGRPGGGWAALRRRARVCYRTRYVSEEGEGNKARRPRNYLITGLHG